MVKVSELPNKATITGSEEVLINDSGVTKKATADSILARAHNHIVSQVTDFVSSVNSLIDAVSVKLTDNQSISGEKTFTNDLYSTAQTILGGGSEVMGILRMGSGFLFGMGVQAGGTLVLHRHIYGSAIILGSWDGTTVVEHVKITSASDMKLGGLDIKPIASSGERSTGTATDRVPTVAQAKTLVQTYSTTISSVETTATAATVNGATIDLSTKGGYIHCQGYITNTSGSNRSVSVTIQISNDGSSWSTLTTLADETIGSTTSGQPQNARSFSCVVPIGKYIRGVCYTSGSNSISYVKIFSQPLS